MVFMYIVDVELSGWYYEFYFGNGIVSGVFLCEGSKRNWYLVKMVDE